MNDKFLHFYLFPTILTILILGNGKLNGPFHLFYLSEYKN